MTLDGDYFTDTGDLRPGYTRVTCTGCHVPAIRLPDGHLVAAIAIPSKCLPRGILADHGPWTDQ